MIFVLIAFSAAFFYASNIVIEDNLLNTSFKKIPTMVFYVSLFNILVLPLLFFFGFPDIPSLENGIIFILVGIFEVLYLYFFYKSLKIMDGSIVAALFSLGQVVLPLLSFIILDEHLLFNQYIGFFIVLFSSVILSIEKKITIKLNLGFIYMLIAAFITSLTSILSKYTMNNESSWINYVVYRNLFGSIFAFSFLLFPKTRKDIISCFGKFKKTAKIFGLNEVIALFGLSSAAFATSGLSPIIVSSIGRVSPFFAILISFILYKLFKLKFNEENSNKILTKKAICCIFIILGVYLTINT